MDALLVIALGGRSSAHNAEDNLTEGLVLHSLGWREASMTLWSLCQKGLLRLKGLWQVAQARSSKPTRRVGIGAVSLTLATFIIIFAIFSKPLPFIVDATEYAIVTAFGRPTQVVTSPGLGFRRAYESIRKLDRRLFVYTSPSAEFLTSEKTQVVAAGTVLWRVADPRKFFVTVFDRSGAESRLGDVLFAELGAAIGRSPLAAFVSIDPKMYRADPIVAEIARRCREVADGEYGIDVVDVQLLSFDFPKQNRLRVYARMTSERGRVSMQYRSEGDEEGLKVRAVAEEERARILGRATELSQERRGEGDAEAARIYAQALRQAPDFYSFLRTLETSRRLARQRTTMVLSADSPLFGVLNDINYFNSGSARDDDSLTGAAPKRSAPVGQERGN
jgi:modulator of FtsH protease HflC